MDKHWENSLVNCITVCGLQLTVFTLQFHFWNITMLGLEIALYDWRELTDLAIKTTYLQNQHPLKNCYIHQDAIS